MKKPPFFSIITPTYNRPQLLVRAIDSVLEQTFTDWELIIIDDSTNTDTEELMKKYLHNEKIIYLKNDKNEGLPFSRNRGLDTANGEWLTFLDDDDFYATNKTLGGMVDNLNNTKLPWCVFNKVHPDGTMVTNIIKKKENYNWTSDFLFGNALRGDSIPVFKKEFISTTRYRGNHRSEWQFWYELAKKSNFVHYPINAVIAEYLPDGMSNLGYLKKERLYQGQQFREMLKNISTWKYLPRIAVRYFLSFYFVQKLRRRMRK